ncbi:MAG: DUF1330 domain-containing protein [Caulobacter sp.]|nr:DUF1330 domain-containing protein [Caulobacter sp.]
MKAYLVLDFAIRDVAGFMPYVAAIPAFIDRHGGRYLVRGETPTPVEGDWAPERLVVLEFPSRAAAQAFLDDPEAQPLFALRHAATDGRLVLADGCD